MLKLSICRRYGAMIILLFCYSAAFGDRFAAVVPEISSGVSDISAYGRISPQNISALDPIWDDMISAVTRQRQQTKIISQRSWGDQTSLYQLGYGTALFSAAPARFSTIAVQTPTGSYQLFPPVPMGPPPAGQAPSEPQAFLPVTDPIVFAEQDKQKRSWLAVRKMRGPTTPGLPAETSLDIFYLEDGAPVKAQTFAQGDPTEPDGSYGATTELTIDPDGNFVAKHTRFYVPPVGPETLALPPDAGLFAEQAVTESYSLADGNFKQTGGHTVQTLFEGGLKKKKPFTDRLNGWFWPEGAKQRIVTDAPVTLTGRAKDGRVEVMMTGGKLGYAAPSDLERLGQILGQQPNLDRYRGLRKYDNNLGFVLTNPQASAEALAGIKLLYARKTDPNSALAKVRRSLLEAVIITPTVSTEVRESAFSLAREQLDLYRALVPLTITTGDDGRSQTSIAVGEEFFGLQTTPDGLDFITAKAGANIRGLMDNSYLDKIELISKGAR